MKPCRDCGYELAANARGCPRCARNLVAEQKLERIIWSGLTLLLLAGALAIFLLRR